VFLSSTPYPLDLFRCVSTAGHGLTLHLSCDAKPRRQLRFLGEEAGQCPNPSFLRVVSY